MMNIANRSVTPWTVQQDLRELRKRYGAQDWLTVVGGVTAEAYRLAGFTGTEFAELLRGEMAQRGRLLIHLRKKANMKLRKGFDGQSGGVTDENGFVNLHLHFSTGYYTDAEIDPTIRTSAKLRSSLLVAGGLNRPIGQLGLGEMPRCLELGGGRVDRISHERGAWGGSTTMIATRRLETLAIMPAHVARELGIDEQEALGHIPWLGTRAEPAHSLRERPLAAPATVAAAGAAAAPRPRPALRLV